MLGKIQHAHNIVLIMKSISSDITLTLFIKFFLLIFIWGLFFSSEHIRVRSNWLLETPQWVPTVFQNESRSDDVKHGGCTNQYLSLRDKSQQSCNLKDEGYINYIQSIIP